MIMELIDYKNKHSGKTCFIFGSGPSIKNQDLSSIVDYYSFCSNWFPMHPEFERLKINYYCAYDDNFVSPDVNEQWYRMIKHINCIFFFPMQWNKISFRLKKLFYVNYRPRKKIYNNNKFSYDIFKGFYNGDTVIINFCIPLAFFMGFEKIILLGCECDYGFEKDNNLDNAYFHSAESHETMNKHSKLSAYIWQQNVLRSYEVINTYAKQFGKKIINATNGGRLNIFPRKKLSEII